MFCVFNLKIYKFKNYEKKFFFVLSTFLIVNTVGINLSIQGQSFDYLMLKNIATLASNGGEETVTMKGYSETELICSMCNKSVSGCIWCSVDDNCKCTVPVHKCTK